MEHADGEGPRPEAAEPDPHMAGGLRVEVLGELSVTRQGRVLSLGGPRQRAVFALLVLGRGSVVTRDRLIDAVWGEEPPPSTVGALQAYISRLRRELEQDRPVGTRGGVIVWEGAGYAMPLVEDAVDAWRFERLLRQAVRSGPETVTLLTEALALWQGPAFAGFEDEPWARTEAARLGELREVARERLLAARLERGEHTDALLTEAEALVAEQPLREERWSLLALVHHRTHGQAEALSVLRRARRTLADRLGIDPGPALRSVEAEVLSHAPRFAASLPQPPSVSVAAAVSAPGSGFGELVERERELAELRNCLSDAVAGRGGLVCVQGPAGAGRSALLDAVRRLGGEWGLRVLSAGGEGDESGSRTPGSFDAVRQLLGPVDAPAGPADFAVLHGLYRLLARLATDHHHQPRALLLAVDDLQACDAASLHLLAHLLPRIQDLPILVVTALRTGEPHVPYDNEQLLADIARDPAVVHIRPEPLSAAGVAGLVRRRLGADVDEEVVVACHRASAGVPLLLTRLLRALEPAEGADAHAVAEWGVRAVSELLLARLERLPSAATAVVRAIAVLGGGDRGGVGGAVLPVVAALTGLSEQDVVTATAALVRAEVVRDQYPLAFVHPLAGEAVLRTVPSQERPALHERAARLLDSTGADPEETAAHLLLVPYRGDPWVVRVLRAAAARATVRGANDVAATLLTRALLEPPAHPVRPEVLLELGRAEALVDGRAAGRHLREAYATSPQRASVARLLAQTLIYTGSPGEAAEFAARAAAELPTGPASGDRTDDERQGLLALARLGAFVHGLYGTGTGTDGTGTDGTGTDGTGTDVADTPAAHPVGDGVGTRMLAADAARQAAVQGLDRAAAVASARFALTDRVLLHSGEVLSWCTAGVVLHLADEDVTLLWDETLTYAGQCGSLIGTLSAHLWQGFAHWRHGDLHRARRSLGTALEQFGAWGVTPGAPQCRAFLTGVLVDLGDLAGARACLERMRAGYGGAEGARLRGEGEARVLIAEGRYAEALAALDGVRHLQPAVVNPVWWEGELLRVRALTGLGERDRAERLAREQLKPARAWGAPGTVGRVLRLLGEARGWPDGVPELREAVGLLADGRAGLEHARAQQSLHALTGGDPAQDAVGRRFPPP